MNLKNPFLLAGAGAPLVLHVASGVESEAGQNVRRATGLVALLSGGLYLWTGAKPAGSVALGTGAAWAIMRMGVL